MSLTEGPFTSVALSRLITDTTRHVEAATCWVCGWVAGPEIDKAQHVLQQARAHWTDEGHQVSLEIRDTQLIVLGTDPPPEHKAVR